MRSTRTTGKSSTRSTTPACCRASGRPSPCWTAETGGSSTGPSTKPISTAFWWTSRPLPRSRSTTRSPTKRGAIRRRARELDRPGPRPHERHEGTRRSLSDLQFAVRLPGRDDEDLPAPRADRSDDPSTRRELVLPRIRNLRGARGRQDAVVRSPLGIAEAAIADDDGHGREARLGEVRPSRFGKPRDAFNRHHVLRPDEVRDEGRVVAGSRPDLEYAVPGRKLSFLEHDRDHRRRGDRLASPDRQRHVGIGVVRILRTNEHLPGYGQERVPNPRILNVPRADQPLHHASAFGREIHRLAHQSVTANAADKLSVTRGPGGR